MAYAITSQGDTTDYGVLEYIVNTEADVASVPTTAGAGSTLAVIGTGKVYMLSVAVNGTKEWKEFGGDA